MCSQSLGRRTFRGFSVEGCGRCVVHARPGACEWCCIGCKTRRSFAQGFGVMPGICDIKVRNRNVGGRSLWLPSKVARRPSV